MPIPPRIRAVSLCLSLLLVVQVTGNAVGVAPPGTAEKIRTSAELLIGRDDKVEADRQLELALSQANDAREKANAYAERGRLLVLAMRFKLAEVDFKQALTIDPNCRAAVTYQCRIWLDDRDYDRVIATLKQEDPGMTNGDEQAILALALLRRDGPGDKEDGIRLADRAWDLGYKDSSFDVEIAAGEAGCARGFISGARSHFVKAATFSPSHPDVSRNLRIVDDFEMAADADRYDAVKHAFDNKEYATAADYCRSVLDRHPQDAEGLELLGKIYLTWADNLAETNQITAARQKLALAKATQVSAVMKQVEERVSSLRQHMLSARRDGNDELALAIAEAQVAVEPEDVEARQIQISAYTRQKKWPELIQAYQDGLTHLAGNPASGTYINQWGMGKGLAMTQIQQELRTQVEDGTANEKQITGLIDVFTGIANSPYRSSYNYEILSDLYALHGDWQNASVSMWKAVGLSDEANKERLERRKDEVDTDWRRARVSGTNAALFLRFHRHIDDFITHLRSGESRPADAEFERNLPPNLRVRLRELRSEIDLLASYEREAREQKQKAETSGARAEKAAKSSDEELYNIEYRNTREAESRYNVAVQNIQDAEARVKMRIDRFWRF